MKRLIRKPVKIIRKQNHAVAVVDMARKGVRYVPIGMRLPITP